MKSWEVVRDGNTWSLLWRFGCMQIGPADLVTYTVAVDAATDFMARFESGDVPVTEIGHNPGELMRQCVAAAMKEPAP